MKLSSVKIDAEKVEGGDWVDNISDMGDLRLKVRGLQNASFRRLQSKLFDAVPRAKKASGRIDIDESDRITAICLLETVLLDWDGIEDENGQPLAYSKEKARELLLDPNFRRFSDAVIAAATKVGEAETKAAQDEAGN